MSCEVIDGLCGGNIFTATLYTLLLSGLGGNEITPYSTLYVSLIEIVATGQEHAVDYVF